MHNVYTGNYGGRTQWCGDGTERWRDRRPEVTAGNARNGTQVTAIRAARRTTPIPVIPPNTAVFAAKTPAPHA